MAIQTLRRYILPMVYNSKRNEILIFGGVGDSPAKDQPQQRYNDTWILKGTKWAMMNVEGPSARQFHAMVYDSDHDVVLLYGGRGKEILGDMWQWNGTQWAEIKLIGETPGKRSGTSMVYDPKRKKTILFGGYNEKLEKPNDTWEWDGTKWSEVR